MTCSRSTWSVPDQLQTASTATHRVVEPTSTAERYDRLKRCPATVPAAAAATVECVTTTRIKQDAQLSQRDRAAGCVIVFAKSRTLELEDNDLRT